jgi:hypothetical protein
VILLDSDVLLIDLRYPNDPRFAVNQQTLRQLHVETITLGCTPQVLLEVVGILSFNVSPGDVQQLPDQLILQYGLTLLPDIQQHPAYAGCTVQELVTQMSTQMALGDAVQAVQISHYARFAQCLLTWNARHFSGKLVIPALTPQDWLAQRLGGTP